jgi:hypothetical protein
MVPDILPGTTTAVLDTSHDSGSRIEELAEIYFAILIYFFQIILLIIFVLS